VVALARVHQRGVAKGGYRRYSPVNDTFSIVIKRGGGGAAVAKVHYYHNDRQVHSSVLPAEVSAGSSSYLTGYYVKALIQQPQDVLQDVHFIDGTSSSTSSSTSSVATFGAGVVPSPAPKVATIARRSESVVGTSSTGSVVGTKASHFRVRYKTRIVSKTHRQDKAHAGGDGYGYVTLTANGPELPLSDDDNLNSMADMVHAAEQQRGGAVVNPNP
jgi:hypothetical protein